MNETLSPSQASRILDLADGAFSSSINKTYDALDEFRKETGKIWADKNAVECERNIIDWFSKFTDEVFHNENVFFDTVIEIVNSYLRVGGKDNMFWGHAGPGHWAFGFSYYMLETFNDGYGDVFGFRDVKRTPEQIAEAITTLKGKLTEIAENTKNTLNSISTFGNREVQKAIAESAHKIIDIMNLGVRSLEKSITDLLVETIKQYISAGAMSSEILSTIAGKAEEIRGKVQGLFDTPPQAKYAPPTNSPLDAAKDPPHIDISQFEKPVPTYGGSNGK